MNHDHAARLLADAAAAATGDWSRQQRRAAHLVANLLACAWAAGLRRCDLTETLLFKGDHTRRTASARLIVAALDPVQLAEIFAQFGPPEKS